MSFLNIILVANLFFALFQFLSSRKRYKQSKEYLEFERELLKKEEAFIRFGRSQLDISKPKFRVKVIKFNGEVVGGYLFDYSKEECEKRLLRWSKHPYFYLHGVGDTIEIKTEDVVHVKIID